MWRGFLIESKEYMNYAKMTRRKRLSFWFRYPRAWFSFRVTQPLRDKLRTYAYRTGLRK